MAAEAALAHGSRIAADVRKRIEEAQGAHLEVSFTAAFEEAVREYVVRKDAFFIDPRPLQELAANLRTEQVCFATTDPKDINQDRTYIGHLLRQLGKGDRRIKCPLVTAIDNGLYLLHEACSCRCGDHMRTPLQVRRPSKEAAILWCATCGEVAPRANRLGDSCPFGHPYEQNTRTRDTLVPAYGVSEFGLEWQRAIGLAADATSYRYIGLNLPAAIALVIEYEAAGAFIIDGANDCGVDVVVVGHHELALAQVKANASISASAEVVQRLRGSRLILGSGAEAASVLTDLVRPDRDKLTGELFETMSRALAVDAARNPIAISFKGWSDTKDTLASVPVTRWDWHNIAAVISGAGHAIPQSFADWVALAFDYDVVATRGALTKVVGRRSAPVLAH